MTKNFTTLEILNIVAWYKQARESEKKPLNSLPLNIQWNLKRNIEKLTPIVESFNSFRDELDTQLQTEYSTDEKSYDTTDEEGNQIRKIKEEYFEDFRAKTDELNQKLNEILFNSNEVSISTVNLDKVFNEETFTDLTMDDLDILSFMNEDKGDA